MKKKHFDVGTDGFYGAYWKCKTGSDCAMIAMIGDDPEAYWRFNEGSGTTFEDCTGHGHTLTTTKNPTWIPGIKSNDPSTPWPGESK